MADSDVDLLIHDLRGVLTTIKSWAALAELQTSRGLLPEEAVQGLLESCQTADAIINGHTSEPTEDSTNLIEFLPQLQRALANEFKQRGVLLQVRLPEPPCWVAASRGDLSIILTNLLRNALEACERGGRTVVSARLLAPNHDQVEVSVEDSGEGLEDTTFESIFTPGVSRRGKGRGLGLHAARAAATRSGGTLHAEHASLGGAAFVLRLDVARQEQAKPPPGIATAAQRRKGRVLIVEDDPATRRFMQAALEHDGHEVLQAGSLKQARALLNQAELVIVDDRLPDGSGPELRHETRSPLIIVSGNPALGQETGLPILRKPFDVLRLCAAVRERLGER